MDDPGIFDPTRGYPSVVPYVRYTDPAAAIEWLSNVLGAREVLRMTLPDGRIGHAELSLGTALITLGLTTEPGVDAPPPTRATLPAMTLVFGDDVDASVERALAGGGGLIDPAVDQPWGLRQAIVADPGRQLWDSAHMSATFRQPIGAPSASTRDREANDEGGSRCPMVVRTSIYSSGMRYLMLMWADADAAGGDETDMQAWVDFDEQVKAAGAFVLNGALAPAASEARLVRTAITGHALNDAVERRPFAEGERQIQAFYIMECDDIDNATEWANKLPTYGYVEVRELLQY